MCSNLYIVLPSLSIKTLQNRSQPFCIYRSAMIQVLYANCTYNGQTKTIVSVTGLDRIPSCIRSRASYAISAALREDPIPTSVRVPNIAIVIRLAPDDTGESPATPTATPRPSTPSTRLQDATYDNTPNFSLAGQNFIGKILYILNGNFAHFDAAVILNGDIVKFKLYNPNQPPRVLHIGDMIRLSITGFSLGGGPGTMTCSVDDAHVDDTDVGPVLCDAMHVVKQRRV